MKILIGYNGTEFADAALDDLVRAGLPDDAEVLILTVAEVCFATVAEADAQRIAESAADRVRKMFPRWSVSTRISTGSAAGEILATADDFRPDLIVLGERKNIFLGPVSQRILTDSACSVRIGRGNSLKGDGPQKIAIGFDGSKGSCHAVRSVASRNWIAGAKARLFSVADMAVLSSIGRFAPQIIDTVVEARFASQWAQTLAAESIELLTDAGIAASLKACVGRPKVALIENASIWGADCIFVGPHCAGNSFERFLLGSVSTAVAAGASCSVEVVRGQ